MFIFFVFIGNGQVLLKRRLWCNDDHDVTITKVRGERRMDVNKLYGHFYFPLLVLLKIPWTRDFSINRIAVPHRRIIF